MTPKAVATSLVKRLFDAGYTAYFAGGWVRDLLLGVPTDEIDIATSAPPEKILSLFKKTVPVGISFGVVVVIEEGISFEVSTFRKDHPYHDGRHPDGVDFSTPEKDALRRDFTINGMFYDPLTDSLHDYVNGQEDLKLGIIRAIGNPEERFSEDRLRMLRAVRFAARFSFTIDPRTEKAIHTHASTLFPAVSVERVWQELSKMARAPHFDQALLTMHRLGLLDTIFPTLKGCSLVEIETKVRPFPHFPSSCPLIVYLLELFPNAELSFLISLCHSLKTPSADVKIAEFFKKSAPLFDSSPDLYTWAHFYAHPWASLFIAIQAAKLPSPAKDAFLASHETRRSFLQPHIKRILCHTPLVTSSQLQDAGISPGKQMGLLLREAERLAINGNCSSPEEVLQQLRNTPFWK